tara:strand:+ start:1083 stop:1289 length:207 start_codon:yes stop_codon:yes gene_type:complete
MIKLQIAKDMLGELTLGVSLIGIGFVIGSSLTSREEWRIMEYESMVEQELTNECVQQWNELNMIKMQD